nr:lysophospholipid acyltransferase family protein [Pseudohalocynthiibacter aestuariivivens]
MSFTWQPEDEPGPARITPLGWLLAGVRGFLLIVILLTGVAILLILRAVERPIYGLRRPVTPFITQIVCRVAFVVLQMRYRSEGTPMTARGAVVANHASWLDIFTLNARKRIYFVSKSEVAGWPGIGMMARAVGTVFIARDRNQAKAQTALFEGRLLAGHRLLFFPEGTSTDGMRVLPFKSTLFAAFLTPNLRNVLSVQAVTVIYTAPHGRDERFYGWWGDMSFGAHMLQVLAAWPQGSVRVIYHPPVRAADFADRKSLAKHLETQVRGAMPPERQHQ